MANQLLGKLEPANGIICTGELMADYFMSVEFDDSSMTQRREDAETCLHKNEETFYDAVDICNKRIAFYSLMTGYNMPKPFDNINSTHLQCFKKFALSQKLFDTEFYKLEIDAEPSDEACYLLMNELRAAFANTMKTECDKDVAREIKFFEFVIKMRVLSFMRTNIERMAKEFEDYESYMKAAAARYIACRAEMNNPV